MKDPREVVARWQEAWNAGDADGLADLFADDAEFVNVVGLWWHDKESIRAAHAFGFAKMFPGSTMTMATPRVRRIGSDGAVVNCRWHLRGQVSPSGEPAGDREGIITFVLERRGSGWITVAAQNTDIQRGTQTHITTPAGRSTIYYEKPER